MKRALAALGASAAGVALFLVMFMANAGGSGALDAASVTQVGVCMPDARLAAPGPAAGRSGSVSMGQVITAAYAAGFRGDDLVIAGAVAKAESDLHPRAVNQNTNGTQDLGTWQINTIHGAILRSGDPFALADNARMAFQIWNDAGQRWGPWVTFWSGSYAKFMDEARAAVQGKADIFTADGCNGAAQVSGAGLADPGAGPQGSDGLTPRAEAVKAATLQHWGCKTEVHPCISTVGGYAPRNIAGTSIPSDHASGNADDIMLPDYTAAPSRTLGNEIAQFWVDNATKTGVHYVIFNHRIWSKEKAAQGWRPYQHPGGGHSPTLDHENHVHVSVLH